MLFQILYVSAGADSVISFCFANRKGCVAVRVACLSQIAAAASTEALSLKTEIGIYNSAYSNQRGRIMW